MRFIFITLLFAVLSIAATGQPLLLQRAIITTKTVVSATNDSAGTTPQYFQSSGELNTTFTSTPVQNTQQGGNKRVILNQQPIVAVVNTNAPVAIESKTWFNDHRLKVVASSTQWTATTVRDNLSGKNVTQAMPVLNFVNGSRVRGYPVARVYYDPKPNDNLPDSTNPAPTVKIIYQDVERKIAGYNCKRAVVNITDKNEAYRAVVWYNTEIKLVGLPVAGDPAFGFAFHGVSKKLAFFDQLAGFPMEFEMDWGNNLTLRVEVTKMNVTKPVRDGVFSLLKEGD